MTALIAIVIAAAVALAIAIDLDGSMRRHHDPTLQEHTIT
jgi:hypothetical protein